MTTKPFSLTYVRTPISPSHYSISILHPKLLALITLTPIFTVITTAHSFLTRRDIFSLLLLIGIGINEIVAQLLKKILKHPRPPSCEAVDFCDSYGMPSSHTQLIFFVTVFYEGLRQRRIRRRRQSSKLDIVDEITTTSLWLLSLLVAYSRVALGYHSTEQVVVGGIVGLLMGVVWLTASVSVSVRLRRMGFYEWTVVKVLGVRDASLVVNVAAVEREALMRAVAAVVVNDDDERKGL